MPDFTSPPIFDPTRQEMNVLRRRVRELEANEPYLRGRCDAQAELLEHLRKERDRLQRYEAVGQREPGSMSLGVVILQLEAKLREEAKDGA